MSIIAKPQLEISSPNSAEIIPVDMTIPKIESHNSEVQEAGAETWEEIGDANNLNSKLEATCEKRLST